MRISFCFPAHNYNKPLGGYKVVYEYANRLTMLGHKVNIIYSIENSLKRYKLPETFRVLVAKIIVKNSPKWFELDSRVERISVKCIADEFIPESDIIFATAVETAEPVSRLSTLKGKKCYIIQDFENWVYDDDKVINTYKLGFHNITISKWLNQLLKEHGVDSTYIRNAIDLSIFRSLSNFKERNKYSIGFLYHKSEKKGSKYIIDGLMRVKKKYPNLEVHTFGVPKRPKEMPEWFHYTSKATIEEVVKIYNKCSIFVCATIEEGFGLTGLESMACGCAFVSSNYSAVYEYAKQDENAILYPIKDSEIMVKSINRLIENDSLRWKIAENGIRTAQEFSWNNSIEQMEKFLLEIELGDKREE